MSESTPQPIPLVHFSDQVPLGFEITRLRKILEQSNHEHDPTLTHRTDFCILIYVDRGAGSHTIDLQSYDVRAGDLVFVGQGQLQRFANQADFDGIMILFTERFMFRKASLSNSVLLNLLYPLTDYPPVIRSTERIIQTIQMLSAEWQVGEDSERADILRALLDYLLLQVCRLRRTTPTTVDSSEKIESFALFFGLIKQHHRTSRNATDYADMMRISYKHLNTVCKEVARSTAKQVIDQFVVVEAKRLLAVGDDPIEELSVVLGFDETTNFVKYFKRYAGETPARFRRRSRTDPVRY
ncbi:MAG: AraC family transcriptional regulator [bacterium]|nr:AraC family transcriptional regulator [bacterium]